MNIEIHRNETSKPIVYTDIENAYTKGQMYCVIVKENETKMVYKYPLCSIFRIKETY